MGGNRASEMFIMILLASGIISGLVIFQGNLFHNYNMDLPEEYSYLNEAQNVSEDITNIKANIENPKITGIEPLDIFIAGVYGGLKAIFGLGNVYVSFVTSLESILKIPAFAVNVVLAAITTVILFSVIQMIIKFKG